MGVWMFIFQTEAGRYRDGRGRKNKASNRRNKIGASEANSYSGCTGRTYTEGLEEPALRETTGRDGRL